MFPPDGLLTSGPHKHHVELHPQILAPDPFASDDCLNDFSPVHQFPPPEPEELNTMNSSEDEPSSGLNGRLRPRKSNIPSPQSNKIVRKLDGKIAQEKPKRTSIPSKASPSKSDDLTNKSEHLPVPHHLCPYCDRKFVSKQAVSKHSRRLHLSASKPQPVINCLFCNHAEADPNEIIRHMVDSHPNQYFACLDCHSRFPSTTELAEHKHNVCEKQKPPYRSKLRQKTAKKCQHPFDVNELNNFRNNDTDFSGHAFNGIVISCELKPSHVPDEADIEDNITTNLILPPSKNLGNTAVLEKNAVIVLDDIQWNKRIPSNFSFHNTDADQILSRLGVVHRSPKTGDTTKKGWFKAIEDATQKFEKCFDTSFYSKVASNVQENLTKFLDGSFNFNPDPDATIKTRKSKNRVIINTAEGFPILLACEQYSRNTMDGYMPRAIAPKHKWKWDNVENVKHFNPDQIKKDTHANNCIITLVSSLDIWTQLCMRRKYENKYNIKTIEKKTEKKKIIAEELKEILESRELPTTKSQIVKCLNKPSTTRNELDFPSSLGLVPSPPKFNINPAVLSGEWVRPRCYVCCACGAQTRDSRALSSHISSQHPNAHVQHYEIVGESLLKAGILKHLYVPPSLNCNRTRPPRGFRDCTKCKKSITIEDLHQHMLDCAGDTPAVRRKCRYRPFGVRRRRPRLPDNRIRKKIRNDIRTRQTRPKNRMRPRTKIRTEVGDAETIRKMLADLPAKRHRAMVVNQMNPTLRPRNKLDKQRAKLLIKRRTSGDLKNSKPKTSKNVSLSEVLQNSDGNRDQLNNKDEDANKPLKSRLKRVNRKIGRQKESLTRKVVLNRIKRKTTTLTEKKYHKNEDKLEIPSSSSENIKTDELSLGNTQQTININSDPQNVREHSSGRNGSNNRDNQRPGSSGQNGNSRNFCAPVQNIPLKHSIARLTANSETHDKSVQFHHLFLVQQECNNVNEHVPSGQRLFFENEAIVTKLDKPPLHFNRNSSSDIAQKSKLNKPRKGLNDCIAMLKNKLVDTDPKAPVAHASIQFESGEPINSTVTVQASPPLVAPKIDCLVKSVASPATKDQRKLYLAEAHYLEKLPTSTSLSRVQPSSKESTKSRQVDKKTTQWRPVNYDLMMSKCNDNWSKKQGSRHRSASTENILVSPQFLTPFFDRREAVIKMTPVANEAYMLACQKPSKTRQPRSTRKTTPIKDQANLKIMGAQSHTSHTIKTIDVLEKNRKKRYDNQKQQNLRIQNITKVNTSHSYSQPIRKPTHNNLNTDVNLVQLKHPEPQLNEDSNVNTSMSLYSNNDFNATVDIPPAHSNINVDSILTAPLDLSGKSMSATLSSSSMHNEIINYDNYETLDLSNKTRNINDSRVGIEHVVDLRVKHSYLYSNTSTAEIPSSGFIQRHLNNTSSDILEPNNEYGPTDLSLKPRNGNICINLSRTPNTVDNEIQDLSNRQIIIVDNNEHLLLSRRLEEENMFPTDLSAKNVLVIDQLPSTSKTKQSEPVVTVTNHNAIDDETPTDLSGTGTQRMNSNSTVVGESAFEIPASENNEADNNPPYDSDPGVIENQIPKPVYDPTLRIPQYKIRASLSPVTFASNSGESNSLGINSSITRSTNADMYLSHGITLSSNSPAYRTQSSTMINNSIIASIEAQERITYSFTKVPLNVAVTTVVGSVPVHPVLNHGITASFTTFDSTRPLYTLANSCISMGKIDLAEPTTTLTNCLLSIPSTTIASTTPVYTLAGTTIVTPFNYGSLLNAGPSISYQQHSNIYIQEHENQSITCPTSVLSNIVPQELYTGEMPIITGTNIYTVEDNTSTLNNVMIPKEIRTVLDIMPSIRRNQLLDTLPKYLSSMRPITILPKVTLFNRVRSGRRRPSRRSTDFISDSRKEQEDIKPICLSQNIEKKPQPEIIDLFATEEFLAACQARGLLTNKISVIYRKTPIIDLTVDEVVTKTVTDTDVNTVIITTTTTSTSTSHTPPQALTYIDPKCSSQRINNDKTASLRAVRIKSPSERQKSKLLSNQVPTTYNGDNLTIQPSDKETFNTSSTNACLPNQEIEGADAQQLDNNIVDSSNLAPEDTNNDEITKDKHNICVQLTTQNVVTSSVLSNDHDPNNLQNKNAHNLLSNITSCNVSSCENSKGPYIEYHKSTNNQNVTESDINLVPEAEEPRQQQILLKGMPNETVANLDEDDSDDDILLAVIVRQKQHQQKKPLAADRKNKKKAIQKTKKTKKEKKKTSGKIRLTKEIALYAATQTYGENSKEVSPLKKDTPNLNLDEYSYNVTNVQDNLVTVTERKDKHCKRKGRKFRENTAKSDARNQLLYREHNETDVSKECNKTTERDCNLKIAYEVELKTIDQNKSIQNEINECAVENLEKYIKSHNKDSFSRASSTMRSPNNIQDKICTFDRNKLETENISDESKERVIYPRLSHQCAESNISVQSEYPGNKKNVSSENFNTIKTMSVESVGNTKQSTCDLPRSQTIVPKVSSILHGNSYTEKVSSDDSEFKPKNANSVSIVSHIDDVIPLRRSRRGKSLYVDGNEQEETSVYTDNLTEHKTPLTKKQLIFSKLLLDEKKLIRDNLLLEKKQSSPVNNTSEQLNSVVDITEIDDKCKSNKRKQSPPARKQIKKKKSFDNSKNEVKIVEDCSKECDSFNVSNNNYEKYQRECIISSKAGRIKNDKVVFDSQKVNSEEAIIAVNEPSSGNVVQNNDKNQMDVDKNEMKKSPNTEKRKIIPVASTADTSQSSKPKKCKLDNKVDSIIANTSSEEIVTNMIVDLPQGGKNQLPNAARRNRSKSVVVKSSGAKLYDPYDIDLEDMGDTTEPLGKQRIFSMKSVAKVKQLNASKFKSTKCDVIATASCSVKSKETKSNVTIEPAEHVSEICDSDESSKSDVPLKKYAEEKKERKNANSTGSKKSSKSLNEKTSDVDESDSKQHKRKCKKTKPTPTVSVNVQNDKARDEVEELRSQQFMESFGFFAQRIPRKSNLLATKKISETFHIIADESDDVYCEPKERTSKTNSRTKNTKPVESNVQSQAKPAKRSKKIHEDTAPHDCYVCGKNFNRSDNLMRHQMTLSHVSKLSEVEMKMKTIHVPEEPNCLIGFKQQLERGKNLQNIMKKDEKNPKSKMSLTVMKQMVHDVYRRIRAHGVKWGVCTLGEVLFVNCSESPNEPNMDRGKVNKKLMCSCANYFTQYSIATLGIPSDITYITPNRPGSAGHSLPSTSSLAKYHFSQSSGRSITHFTQSLPSTSGLTNKIEENLPSTSNNTSSTSALAASGPTEATTKKSSTLEKTENERSKAKSGVAIDSSGTSAKATIEQVNVKETNVRDPIKNNNKSQSLCNNDIPDTPRSHGVTNVIDESKESNYGDKEVNKSELKPVALKAKKHSELKEKKNPDIIESIDIFEDKFDKIKRKCRSQAAAAKQVQTVVEPTTSKRGRKKSEKKKTKKSSTKHNQNTVLTKGALKGYDGVKVSISTADINMSAIVPPIVSSPKKKKKTGSKKKRDRKYSESSQKCETNVNRSKEMTQKSVDVYEFMDNEEPEVFELRPSTLMERFKQMNSRDLPGTSKANPITEDVESSDSGSDGDDFVYMSDDYVASDEETENSLSCERAPLKKKDVVEKNAVMGKIFRHNAVRSERKGLKNKEPITEKPQPVNPVFDKRAELDELFDKLLEEAHSASKSYDLLSKKVEHSKKSRSPSQPLLSKEDSRKIRLSSSRESSPNFKISSSRYASSFDPGPSTSKRYDDFNKYEELSKDYIHPKKHKALMKKSHTITSKDVEFINNDSLSLRGEDLQFSSYSKVKTSKNRSPMRKKDKSPGTSYDYNYKADYIDQEILLDDAGVARQRARRKCTVGKQNILAETWSSESEPDGIPPRPNSTESVVLGSGRKKKGKKRDGQISGGRKSNVRQVSTKKVDVESRVSSTNRSHGAGGSRIGCSGASGVGTSSSGQSLSLPGPSGIGPRLRPSASFWAPDGDEEQQEHVQQHGWIVGDSHKKLVTMLAHAKGRKRNNDDKSHLIE